MAMGSCRSTLRDTICRSAMDSAQYLFKISICIRSLTQPLFLIQATELSTNAVHALMDPYESHFFSRSTPATITFPEGVRDFDKWFLFLILLRMETRRLEVNRRRRSSRASALNRGAFAGSTPGAF